VTNPDVSEAMKQIARDTTQALPYPAASNDASSTPATQAGTSRAVRRFLVVSVALLVAACSSIRLGYNNADTLLLYAVDSYVDLDDEQETLARERIAELHRWHRQTQLDAMAQLLRGMRGKLGGEASAADVQAIYAEFNATMATLGERAAPDLAALALTLAPAQIDRLRGKLADDSSKARRELVRFAGPESAEQRVERSIERVEDWFGSVTDAQRTIIREAVARRPGGQSWWQGERERRQAELVALLQRIRTEQPPAATATQWIRSHFAALTMPTDPERREQIVAMRQANSEVIAKLVSSATPQQRAALSKKINGYLVDVETLAAAR
jgi:Family of unknown function (DUF6279)